MSNGPGEVEGMGEWLALVAAQVDGPVGNDWIGLAALVTAILGGAAGLIAAILRSRDNDERDDVAGYRSLVGDLRAELSNLRKAYERDRAELTGRVERVEHELVEARAAHASCEERLGEERVERATLARRLDEVETEVGRQNRE